MNNVELNYEKIITELGNKIAQLSINETILLIRLKEASEELEFLRTEVNEFRRKEAEKETTVNQPVNGGI